MKTKIVFLFVALMAFNNGFSQEQPDLRQKANVLYKQFQYAKAAVIYQKLAVKKNPIVQDLERLANCYQKMNEYEKAETWYAQLVKHPKSSTETLFDYGKVLKANAKYAEAKKAFEMYAAKVPKGRQVSIEMAGCDSALVWMTRPSFHHVKNEANLNTALSEFSVFQIKNSAYYSAEPESSGFDQIYGWTGSPFLKVFSASVSSNGLEPKGLLKDIPQNIPWHIGPVCSNKEGDILYVTRTFSGKEGIVLQDEGDKFETRKLELYIYTQNKLTRRWTERPFKHNNVQAFSTGHAALSEDEKVLYFVSDRPGGLGGTDIWFCELQPDGSWGKPQNAGNCINTSADELFPTVIQQNLYFSTTGFAGMGGLDIFQSTGSKKEWTSAINLKYPVNSSRDDFSFILRENGEISTGYLSSNRIGGKGKDDIYSFVKAPPKLNIAVKGKTLDKKDLSQIPDVSISLLTQGQPEKKQLSNITGDFLKDQVYTLVARKEQFLADSITISTKGMKQSDTLEITLKLDRLEKGKTFRLDNVFYDLDKDAIRADAALILNSLELTMRENPSLRIELASHTDSRGKDAYNLALSQRRAQSAVNYLVSKGISATRLVAKGYGESRLLNSCVNGVVCSDSEHQLNRRTEFTVLSY